MTTLAPTTPPVASLEPILTAFERADRAHEPAWLRSLREGALTQFVKQGFPTTRHEEWKYTPVASIARFPFHPAPPTAGTNGALASELTRVHLAKYAQNDANPFVALNTAFFAEVTLLHLPKDKVVTEPIHLRFTSRQAGVTAHPRILIVAKENSQATIIEEYSGDDGAAYFTNAVTEIVVGEGANIEHCKIQRESPAAFHVATIAAHLARDSKFTQHSIALGACLSRNDIHLVMTGEGADSVMNGLYVADGQRLVDHHTVADHTAPHCGSREFYHGILGGKARGVFNGKIFVRPGAQKTDAKQTNKALLLSDEATVDSKPQLEIFADDVKCTHGAAIGQLDEQAIFYMRARGIGDADAQRVLTLGFAREILKRIRIAPVREELMRWLTGWLRQQGANQ